MSIPDCMNLHQRSPMMGNTLYFTRNNFKDGKYINDENGIIRLKILARFSCRWGIGRNIEEFPFNSNDSYSTLHIPLLAPMEKQCILLPICPDPLGESDIFQVSLH